MLTVYRMFNYAGCLFVPLIVSLAVMTRHFEVCKELGVSLLLAWSLIAIVMTFVAFFCKFNKLPSALYLVIMAWSPIVDAFIPSAPSTFGVGISVNMLAAICLLVFPHYFCARSTEGEGDAVSQEFENLFLNPVSVGILTAGIIPAGLIAAMASFRID